MKGYENVGGIAGYNAGGTVSNCYFDGTVSANYKLGGIAGFTNGVVENCCAFGSVTAPNSSSYYVGAIAGFNNGYGTNGVFDCYYLEDCAFDGTVVQNGLGKKENGATTEDADGSTIKKAEADFADGSITYSLNGGITDGSQAWYQTVGEGRPALSGRTVYFSYASCSQSGEGAYSNTATPAHQFSNGFCSSCGGYERPAGQGTVEAPYLIDNAGKLYWFAAVVNSGYGDVQQNLSACAKLTADITDNTQTVSASVAGDRTWTPIGALNQGYAGTFDGNGKTISGLYYKNTSIDYIGIFGNVAEAGNVKNITVSNSYFAGNYYVGSIAGINYGTIEGCTNHSKAAASYYIGGIAGENNGLITGCSNTADLSNAGGIATRNYGTISDCTNSGNITGGGSGGITRWNPGTIINCSNSGTISGSSGAVGGISYTCVDGKISHCVNTGAVKGTGTSSTNERVGGIIGWNEGTIEYCVNKGTLSGARTLYDAQFGGIAGRNDDRIRCCANLANLYLSGVSKVGGIVGYAGHMSTSTVQDCYNLGDIRGYGTAVAGICGDTGSAPSVLIKNCYDTGASDISGTTVTSGIVVLNCYVLSDVSDSSGTDGIKATAEEFASGKIAWLLNGEAATGESVWGQNIDGADPDPYPVLGTPLVYYGKTDCQEEDRYTNTQTGVGIHTMKKTSAVEATCTADGNNEYYTCSKCGGVFADSNGDTETTAAEQTIGRIPHAFGAPTFTWSEDHSSCSAVYTCEYGCGETESETCTVVAETVAGADCKHQGTITHTATCGEYTDTVELPGAYGEHTSGEPVRENVVEATCKKAGSYEEVVYCTVCSAELSRTQKTIEKLTEHLDCVTIEMNRVESTCVTAGGYDEVTVCTICEERVGSRKVQLPLADHTMEKADFYWAEDYSCQVVISCTVEGCTESKTEACTVTSKTTESKDCQTPGTIAYSAVFEEFTDTITIETGYADHRQGSAVRENEVPATCLEEGSYDEVVYCSVCEIELSREKKTIEKTETHTEETIPGKAATCAEPGLKEGKKCGVCGIILVAQEEIPALGHSFADGVCGNCGLYGGYCGDADINGGKNVMWLLDSEGLMTISGTGKMEDYSAYNVPWIDHRAKVKALVVEEGVTRLGTHAFRSCTAMETVSLPESLTVIGEDAFAFCSVLTSVSLPRNLSSIEGYAFYYCDALTEITIPASVKSMGTWIFNSNGLKTVTFEGSAPYINTSAFYGVTATVYYPDEDSSWEGVAGHDFGGLLTWVPPVEGALVVGKCGDDLTWRFNTLENTLWILGTGAMYDFTEDTVPWAEYRERITSVSLISSQFGGTLTYKNVDYGTCGTNVRWSFDASTGTLTLTGTGTTSSYFSGSFTPWTYRNDQIKAIHVGEGITNLPSYIFEYCTAVTQVNLPETLASFSPNAFNDCKVLNNLLIPRSVYEITKDNFNRCNNLTDIYYLGTAADWDQIKNSDSFKVRLDGGDAAFTVHFLQWHEPTATCEESGVEGHYAFEEPSVYDHMYNQDWQKITTLEKVPALGHEWTGGSCTTPKTCVICGKDDGTVPGHKWSDATCTEAKTCSVCGETEGEALGHKWTDADCTTPKTCSVCGESEGEALGHKWTDATCTEPKTCSVCGETEGEALGHDFVDGKCSRCEEKDPDYKEPEVTGVTRIFGATRYDTAFKAADQLKENLGIEKFENIVVAYGEDFADALSGSYLANQKNAPILLVKNRNKEINLVKDYIKSNLTSGGTVYLLGGVNAVPKAMENGLEGFNVKRLAGATRYETNLEILKEAGISGNDILVCTGLDFADGLSASAVNKPILLVKDSLRATQVNYLKTLGTKNFYLIGGTNAVNKRIESALSTYGTTQRIEGATRYYTSVNIAKTFFPNAKTAVLAYAQNFPDGLSGGCLACSMNAPLILTSNGKQAPAVAYAKEAGITGGAVLGGTGLIPDKVVRSIFAMNEEDLIIVK